MAAVQLIFQPPNPDPNDTTFDDALREVETGATQLCLVSPFLGVRVLQRLTSGRDFRLVTDVEAHSEGGTDRDLIAFLAEHQSKIRTVAGVHAKVVLGPGAALVGSANLTLTAFERRLEMACLLRAVDQLRTLSMWFEALWAMGEELSPRHFDDLARHAEDARRRQQAAPGARSTFPRRGRLRMPVSGETNSTAEPSTPAPDMSTVDELAQLLQSLTSGRAQTVHLLELFWNALDLAGLPVEDRRLHLNFGRGRLSFTIGQRHVLWCKRLAGVEVLGLLLDDFDAARRVIDRVEDATLDWFLKAGKPDAPIVYVPLDNHQDLGAEAWESWRRALVGQVKLASSSGYRRHSRPELYAVLKDASLRQLVARTAWPKEPGT